jgi:hypothetical protein
MAAEKIGVHLRMTTFLQEGTAAGPTRKKSSCGMAGAIPQEEKII